MKIYVGRWDLLPEEWEGYNELVGKTEAEIFNEIVREVDVDGKDRFIAIYKPREFEDTFNGDLIGAFNNEKYWIKIF